MTNRFVATPVCGEFMRSPSYVRVIAGPVGSSKSVTAVHELLRLASLQAPNAKKIRRTRAIIVRNTADQLTQTTRKTVFDWLPPGEAGHWKASEKTYTIQARLPDGTLLESEWLFAALDTPDDVRKALGYEATFLWGNEGRELDAEVVSGLLSRVNRFPSMREGGPTRACGIFDTNMPDEDTWWWEQLENPPANWKVFKQPAAIISLTEYLQAYGDEPTLVLSSDGSTWNIDPAAPILDKDGNPWLVNPLAENLAHLKSDYYPNNIPGKTEDWLRVYLRSQYGRSLSGTPVYEKSFNADFHIAKESLKPTRAEAYPIGIGMDFGRSPAAVFKQRDPRGRILTLGEITSVNTGLDTFIRTRLNPYIARRFPMFPLYVAPDPSGYDKQQANEHSLVDQLKAAGFRCVKPPSNLPNVRIQAVERLLSQQVEGKAMYLIDPVECPVLVKGFRYGYRYKIKRNGELEDTPDKNEHSHVHDANQYIDAVIDMGVRGVSVNTMARVVERVPYQT